jgi:hypothetical protein
MPLTQLPLTQQIFLVAVVVLFSALPLALLYGWIVTKGWEETPAATKVSPAQPTHQVEDERRAA